MNFLRLFLPDKKEQRLSMIAKLPPEQQQCYKGDGSGLENQDTSVANEQP